MALVETGGVAALPSPAGLAVLRLVSWWPRWLDDFALTNGSLQCVTVLTHPLLLPHIPFGPAKQCEGVGKILRSHEEGGQRSEWRADVRAEPRPRDEQLLLFFFFSHTPVCLAANARSLRAAGAGDTCRLQSRGMMVDDGRGEA